MRNLLLFVVGCICLVPFTHASSSQFLEIKKVVYDDLFYQFIDKDSQVEILASEFGWAEGPVWVESLNALLFSDLSADKIFRWDETSGLSDYLFPSGHAPDDKGSAWRGSNGLAIDQQGALVLAQQGGRKLARMSAPVDKPTPDYEVLSSQFEGKLLNSPNDLVVHPSGDIYFTDPPYGLAGFENSSAIELGYFGVFRLTKNNDLILVNKDLEKPNGIALSSDHSTLYVSNSEEGKVQIWAITLDGQGDEKKSQLFFDGQYLIAEGPGSTDGMTVHSSDFLFVSIPNGFGILSPKGELLGKLVLGQVTNLALDHTQSYLYITSPSRLLRLKIR
jgi:gluconolactonase